MLGTAFLKCRCPFSSGTCWGPGACLTFCPPLLAPARSPPPAPRRYAKLRHEKNKAKKKERQRRAKELARAEELGVEPPPKAVPKVPAPRLVKSRLPLLLMSCPLACSAAGGPSTRCACAARSSEPAQQHALLPAAAVAHAPSMHRPPRPARRR